MRRRQRLDEESEINIPHLLDIDFIMLNFFIVTALTGLANIFIFQAIINISSSLNIIPTKGMTLPFISYGGSSFISSSIIVGFILLLVKEEKNAK